MKNLNSPIVTHERKKENILHLTAPPLPFSPSPPLSFSFTLPNHRTWIDRCGVWYSSPRSLRIEYDYIAMGPCIPRLISCSITPVWLQIHVIITGLILDPFHTHVL